MSDPLKELEKTCKIYPDDSEFGKSCQELIRERNTKGMGDFAFVNKFFASIEKDITDNKEKKELLNKLEEFIDKKDVKLRK